jgi:DNA polymerase III subunit delta'
MASITSRNNPDLLGHADAERTLARALRAGTMPHAWLLTGPRGIGKATLAFRFARALLAPDWRGEDLAVPLSHRAARLIAQGAHPDLHVIERETDSRGRLRGEIVVETVRDRQSRLRTTAGMGGARVLLVDGADSLNRSAANALLKILEEPPEGVVLLLVAHRRGRVPATLRSRTAELRLRPLGLPDLLAALDRVAPDADARALAHFAEGSVGRALDLSAIGWPALHERLLAVLAGEGDTGRRLALAEALAKAADSRGFAFVVELIQDVLCRAAHRSLGLEAGAEPVPIGLDRLAALWDNLARLAGRVEGLHLDRTHAFVHLLAALAPPRPASDPR